MPRSNELYANGEPLNESAGLLSETSAKLYREAEMLGMGVGGAVWDTVRHPSEKLPELGASFATGAALGSIARLGAPGKVVAAGIGIAMGAKFAYDELTGNRWSKFGSAMKDAWQSPDHMQNDIDATRNSLGSFIVDTGIGLAGMKLGSVATAQVAAPGKLMDYAVKHADSDGGAALRGLQDRWENPAAFQKNLPADLELLTHTQPAEAGSPRGDLIRVATTADGNVLLAAMDVEGHGIGAAKKAVTVHSAIDQVLPQTSNAGASDILGMIDQKLNPNDELSITAAMAKYNATTHELHTATASSELAFVVRADGAVQQLDAAGGGLGLGVDMYSMLPKADDVIHLNRGDTVVLASDGVFDRFGYGKTSAFAEFLQKTGPNPEAIRSGILKTPAPETGTDDTSFVVFRRS